MRRAYVWTDEAPIAQIDRNTLGQETIVYLHTDHQGTPRLATNQMGVVVWRWVGSAFGDIGPNEDPDNDGNLTTVNLRYDGQYFDAETGLHYNWFRYYDPKVGRYITSDPIGLRGGLNTYPYVRNNPLRYTDPSGLLDPTTWIEPVVKTVTRIGVGIGATVSAAVGGVAALLYSPPAGDPAEDQFVPPNDTGTLPAPTCHTKADCEEAFRIQWSICSRLQGEARRKCQQNATNLLAQCLQSATD